MNELLLDTHTLLWFFWDDPRLSTSAKHMIEDPHRRKLASIASCWEIAIKVSLNKLFLGEPCQQFLQREIIHNNFELLPITLDHATQVENLTMHHKDPFDRLLIAQCMIENIPIIGADTSFDAYPVCRLW